MVEFVRHTLVDGTINLDVHVVANFVSSKVGGQCDGTLLPEWPRERVSGTRSQTMTSRHFQLLGFLPSRKWSAALRSKPPFQPKMCALEFYKRHLLSRVTVPSWNSMGPLFFGSLGLSIYGSGLYFLKWSAIYSALGKTESSFIP